MKNLVSVAFLTIILGSFFFSSSCNKIIITPPNLPDNSINCDSLVDNSGAFKEIPNLNFEYWTLSSSGRYEEPTPNCFWTTPSKSNDIIKSIPITVTKVSGDSAHSGRYGCMIKTQQWGSLITSGTVASGVFSPNFNNPLQSIVFGRTFTKRVKEVRGWYKFWSVNQDSCSFYCYLLKKNTSSKWDTLGFSRIITHETRPDWTEFVLTPVYNSTETPEKLVLYFASSEEGDELKGQAGNTLIVDDVSVTYY
jgi:hypothetical protein